MIRIGIDPGQTGAIAVLDGGAVVSLVDMPIMGRTHGKGQQVDPYALARIFKDIGPGDIEWVTVEQVGHGTLGRGKGAQINLTNTANPLWEGASPDCGGSVNSCIG